MLYKRICRNCGTQFRLRRYNLGFWLGGAFLGPALLMAFGERSMLEKGPNATTSEMFCRLLLPVWVLYAGSIVVYEICILIFKEQCAACGARDVLPADSPAGRELVESQERGPRV
jgi:hypothetical protein